MLRYHQTVIKYTSTKVSWFIRMCLYVYEAAVRDTTGHWY